MSVLVLVLAVAAGYLIGSIPFGLLVARWFGRVDIRTVGSGNIGATNVGRVLGFRFFLLVFVLDMLKGLGPTLGLPLLLARLGFKPGAAEPVLIALATVLGHNFPLYLRFRGGKGVATSFGALLALDPIAMLSAGIGFVTFLLVTRFVSLSSILAGFVFAAVHFALVPNPWTRDQLPMSVVTIGLLGLLVARHRANLARIGAGTEPKVSMRKKKGPRTAHQVEPAEPPAAGPAGRARPLMIVALALGVAGSALAYRVCRPAQVDCGGFTMTAVARVRTGHQRAGHIAFADEGRLLAVTCPRYNRLLLYRVEHEAQCAGLERACDVPLEGRPMAIRAQGNRLYVLERPIADAHHVEAGWLEAFDLAGNKLGSRLRVGFDPDDFVLAHDGRTAVIVTSGHAEGEANRPDPELLVVDLAEAPDQYRVLGKLTFDQPRDDPEQVALSRSGQHAVVKLIGSNQVATVDLADSSQPRLVERVPLPRSEAPRVVSVGPSDDVLMPADSERVAVSLGPLPAYRADWAISAPEFCAFTLPDDSGVEVAAMGDDRPVGRLTLRGPANLGAIRPTGLAYDPAHRVLAVADRAGAVHLVSIRDNHVSR